MARTGAELMAGLGDTLERIRGGGGRLRQANSKPEHDLRSIVLTAFAAALLLAACSTRSGDGRTTVRLWGLGREGEVLRTLAPEFERRHPDVHLIVQQIPWTSAHEKLLTAFVGKATPDLAQLGNTWIPEFAAIGALERLDSRAAASPTLPATDYFPGVWRTNLYEGGLYGIPWYVDTRVLFYRPDLLARAGFGHAPRTWKEWREAMRRIRPLQGEQGYPILLPTNEWEQVVLFGISNGAGLLTPDGTRGAFSEPAFAAAADFYVSLFHDRLAPLVSFSQFGNVYQEFARGTIAMWITGPWNLGEFRRRLPPEQQHLWMTSPLPAPEASHWPGESFAGGSSIALFAGSPVKEQAWKVVEFLADPAVQARFYALSGDLPARVKAWEEPALAADEKARAFRVQLEHVTPMPRVPEWEQIAQKVPEDLEPAVRSRESAAAALRTLDRDVDQILEKRRWMLARRNR
jgi:multiple sugar transport system substrate-binding protein